MIKYLGSKKNFSAMLSALCFHIKPDATVIEPFSGTSRVGLALKSMGNKVICGDHNHYAYTLAACHVQADLRDHDGSGPSSLRSLIKEMNAMQGKPGYFTETYCEKSRFFKPENGAKIDVVRDWIDSLSLSDEQKAILVTSVIEAADKVDSTVGIQMAYLKEWADRAHKPIEFLFPEMKTNPRAKSEAYRSDAIELMKSKEADIAYLDPPYNQHKYLGNYHIWETLSLWDKPEVYGVAQKRLDCKDRMSDFNSKVKAEKAVRNLLASCKAPHIILSYNNEGYVAEDKIKEILRDCRSELVVYSQDHARHIGHKIGIFSPSGIKKGEPTHARTTEYIFFATDDKKIADKTKRQLSQYLNE